MSQVKIEWTLRAAGRWPGHQETVELTPYVHALIKQKRVVVIEAYGVPVLPELIAALTAEIVKPIESEPSESEALGLTAPKPRTPRKPKGDPPEITGM